MRAFNHVAWFASIVAVMGCEPPSEGNDGKKETAEPTRLIPVFDGQPSFKKLTPESLGWPTYRETSGDAGWEGSSEPICDDAVEGNTLDVWADARGVFVLASDKCNRAVLDSSCIGRYSTSVWLNSGNGWTPFLENDPSIESHQLAGQEDGDLWLTTTDCGVLRVDESGVPHCADDSDLGDDDVTLSSREYSINGGRVFALGSQGVWVDEDGEFSLLAPLPQEGWTLHASDEWLLVGASNAAFLVSHLDGQVETLPPPPAGDYSASFGRAPDDLWLGSSAGWLVHFDGTEWVSFPWGTLGAVNRFWGTADVIYFQSSRGFGRIRAADGQPEVLFYLEEDSSIASLEGMWGRAKDEVFLVGKSAIENSDETCSPIVSLVFDGEKVHAF